MAAFDENSPQGSHRDAAPPSRGRKPLRWTLVESEKRRAFSRPPGGLFFVYFLLAVQKKVRRPWVRKPTFNPAARSASYFF
ncbi:hypothetical protein ELQ36_03020 [Methylococcus capsulatus]|nr:hypothetical protein [Methylococcus capsulatus]